MKIYPQQLPLTAPRADSPWAFTCSMNDPLIIAFTCLVVLAGFGESFRKDDLLIILLTFFLTYPGRLPFHRYSAGHVLQIALDWTVVVSVLLLVRLVRANLGIVDSGIFETHAISVWAATAALVLIDAHRASPAIAPYVRRLYKERTVVIAGVNQVALRFAELINKSEGEGQRIVGYFDDRQASRCGNASVKAAGCMDSVVAYVKQHGVDIIYIALPMKSQPRILALLSQLRDTTASIFFLPDIFIADFIQGRVEVVFGVPAVAVCDTPFHGAAGTLKRILDVSLTVASLPLVLPLMVIIGMSIKAGSPGPAVFKQKRYGLDGKSIVVWQFRTMTTLEDGELTYRQVTRDGVRVTPIGTFLRKTSLDELPQLINVLGGSMSLVGPRPHALAVNEQYRKLIPGYMIRHKVKPGITGWAQVNGCRGGDDLESMRRRTEFDLAYLRSWSVFLVLIIWKTAVILTIGDPRAY